MITLKPSVFEFTYINQTGQAEALEKQNVKKLEADTTSMRCISTTAHPIVFNSLLNKLLRFKKPNNQQEHPNQKNPSKSPPFRKCF